MDIYAPLYTCTLRYWGLHGNEATLFALVCYHYRKVGGGALRMRVSTLAGEVGVNERTGKRVLVALHDHGFIRANFEGKKGELVEVNFVRPTTGGFIPLYFHAMQQLGLKGNDAILYSVIADLCHGKAKSVVVYTTGSLAAKCSLLPNTTAAILTRLYKAGIIGGGRESKTSSRVSFFLCEDVTKYFQNTYKTLANNLQNVISPCTPLGVNINKEKEKEKENFKEKIFEAEKEQPLNEEEKAKIRMHQQSVMEKLSRAEAIMKPGAGTAKIARQTSDYAVHNAQCTMHNGRCTPGGLMHNEESIEQRATRLMQEAYEKGRAMAATITDRALAERMIAASFHDEPNKQLQEMQRRRCMEGWETRPSTAAT